MGFIYGTEEVYKNGLAYQLLLLTFKVSWIRQRDSHILTVDRMTFISDDRFQILNGEKKNAWTLRIRYPKMASQNDDTKYATK